MEKLKSYTLEIPYKFPSYNTYINECRKNRYAGAKMKKQIQEDIGYFINKVPQFEKPVRVSFTWIEANKKRDFDNVGASKKFILDALVEHSKLKDDNRNCVIGYIDNFEYGDDWKVVLEIVEVEDGENKTNADRIRSMTDEELLEFLKKMELQLIDYGIAFCGAECDETYTCEQCLKTWLNRPFENNSFWSRDVSVKEDF